ncbi:hypothetical protein [Streptomyces sp. P17]|uniref:hypothetical protein n=1 Tax=Streptomyces sp. P17 TaxID=3074716 RepID=UPI0028F3F1E3|nr:hypothetical protein [Streptomyces sp. P17]MDT9699012.1 hypothetical protein [Streptomyces sp. P17]
MSYLGHADARPRRARPRRCPPTPCSAPRPPKARTPSPPRTGALTARADGTPGGASLAAGQTLAPGDSLLSKSAKVTMGADGNLTIASNTGKTLWSSGTGGNAGATATPSASGT